MGGAFLLNSSFSYSSNSLLLVQSFYDAKVNVIDVNNDERVSSSELTVRCFGVSYIKKILAILRFEI